MARQQPGVAVRHPRHPVRPRSTWLEVDLRFKLNLGPVQVSGATIRATLEDNGSVSASLRGLDASLTVAGVIEGKGGLELLDEADSPPRSM